MPLSINWDNDEKSIIKVEMQGHWTWDEYHKNIEKLVEMVKSVEHRVDVMIVDTPGASIPPGSPVPHFNRLSKMQPSNTGVFVIVTSNVVVRTMVTLYNKVIGRARPDRFITTTSTTDAYAFFEQKRVKNTNP